MNERIAAYEAVLRAKAKVAHEYGFAVNEFHPSLFGHQRDMIR